VSEPKRYQRCYHKDYIPEGMEEHYNGKWVKWEDYARLKAEVERLTKALAFSNSLAKDLYGMLDLRMSKKDLIGIGFTKKQADEEWEAYRASANAAKEGKQS